VKTSKYIIATIFLTTILSVPARAQKTDIFGFKKKPPKPYVQKIYVTASFWDGIGLSGTLYTKHHSLYTLRYLNEDQSLNGSTFWMPSQRAHLNEFGIMYGKGFDIWRFFFNGSMGFGYVNYKTDLAPQLKESGGFMGNLQASYALKPWMAVGFEFYGDLNVYQPRTGFLINLHFGKVRKSE
jgi:hypothetical protein